MKLADLFEHAGRAAFWGALAKWMDVAVAFVTFLLMVRVLPPETFGVWGLALLVTLIPETIVGGALSENLIQREPVTAEDIASLTSLQFALSLAMALGLAASAPWISAKLGHLEIEGLIVLLALTAPLIALSSPPAALLLRQLRFRDVAIVDAAGTASAAFVGLALVFSGFGIWSLAWMEVVRRTSRAIGFLILGGWPLATLPRFTNIGEMTRFGSAVLGTRLLQQADMAVPRLFLGLASAAALGYFNLAQRLFQQSTGLFVAPFTGMAMPLASRIRDDSAKLSKALEGAIRVAALVSYPVFMGAAALAPILVPLLLGDAWAPAILPVQLMLLLGVRSAAASLNGSVLRAVGQPGSHLVIVIVSVLTVVALAPVVASWGASAIALLLLARGALTWALGARLLERATGFSAQRQLMTGWQAMTAATLMAIIVYLLQFVLRETTPALILALALIFTGVILYVGFLYLLSPSLVRLLLGFTRALIRRDQQRMSAIFSAWASPP